MHLQTVTNVKTGTAATAGARPAVKSIGPCVARTAERMDSDRPQTSRTSHVARFQDGKRDGGAMPKVLLIGTTGVTGRSAVAGLSAAGALDGDLECYALTRNATGPAAQALASQGLQLVQGNLDNPASLEKALANVDMVYCHALSVDAASADPLELERAKRLAAAAKAAGVQLIVYNSSGGKGKGHGISQAEQKNRIEDIISDAGVPLCALQATLFMEELWKKYTRPGILKGTFTWSTPSDKPIQLLAARDMGLAAGYVLQNPSVWSDKAIELAGDELTPLQMCEAFSRAQGGMPVRHSRPPTWPFWLINRDLWRIAKFYSEQGYSANVPECRKAFPGMLTFTQFLELSNWGNADLTYDQGISFMAAAQPRVPVVK